MGLAAAYASLPLALLLVIGISVPVPTGVTVAVAWAVFIGGIVGTGVIWFRTPDPEMESEFDPAPGDDAEFVRGDQVRHTSGRVGQIVGPGDPRRSRVKWLDTWDVSQANNRDLDLDEHE